MLVTKQCVFIKTDCVLAQELLVVLEYTFAVHTYKCTHNNMHAGTCAHNTHAYTHTRTH